MKRPSTISSRLTTLAACFGLAACASQPTAP